MKRTQISHKHLSDNPAMFVSLRYIHVHHFHNSLIGFSFMLLGSYSLTQLIQKHFLRLWSSYLDLKNISLGAIHDVFINDSSQDMDTLYWNGGHLGKCHRMQIAHFQLCQQVVSLSSRSKD